MGATRKLQGEIDRVLKKVTEGVDVFDGIWNKVYDTENANLKEKFESDLKKEIKKLQRYRDQIKTWIQSSEVKDKKPLLDARRNIEKEMERFKVCEKETKTKAFSKEGLGQLPKTDPREKAKGEAREWVNTAVSDLEGQVDSFEAEMENLVVKKGKARPPRLTHLDTSVARHKAHIAKLEMILRLLENDELAPDEVNDVRDLIQDYLDRNQDDPAEFEDTDALYDQLPAEKMEALDTLDAAPPGLPPPVAPTTQASLMKPPLPPPPQAAAAALAKAADAAAKAEAEAEAIEVEIRELLVDGPPTSPLPSLAEGEEEPSSPPPQPVEPKVKMVVAISPHKPGVGRAMNPLSPRGAPAPSKEEEAGPLPTPTPTVAPTAAPTPTLILTPAFITNAIPLLTPLGPRRPEGGLGRGAGPILGGRLPAVASTTAETSSGPDEIGSSLNLGPGQAPPGVGVGLGLGLGGGEALGAAQQRMFSSVGAQWRPGLSSAAVFQNQNQGAGEAAPLPLRSEIPPDQKQRYISRYQQVQQQGVSAALGVTGIQPAAPPPLLPVPSPDPPHLPHPEAPPRAAQAPSPAPAPTPSNPPQATEATQAGAEEGARVEGGGPEGASAPHLKLTAAQAQRLALLDTSFQNLPPPPDAAEKTKFFFPRNPIAVPASFPTVPPEILDKAGLWDKLESDVLFFSFYFQQGRYSQYLAARALKRGSWRYHKKYATWFQRHEEPKVTNTECEQGTYVYFDFNMAPEAYQQGWCQRIKTEFTFEYAFLEDELQV